MPCPALSLQLDKEALQATIRALTREAAMLAEQAQRALLPAGQPGAPSAAAGCPPRPTSAPAAMAAGAEPQALSLVRDWSQALSEAGSCGGRCSSARQAGAAWQPGTSVRSFEWADDEAAQRQCSGSAAAAAAAYVQGCDPEGAASDKRRRLAPGMLAHCLRPTIREAVAEAAAMEASGSGSCRLPTPGRMPKRKLRQLSSGSITGVAPVAAAAAEGEGAAAADVPQQQQEQPSVALPALSKMAESVDFRTFELLESRWHGAAKAPAAGRQRASTCRLM